MSFEEVRNILYEVITANDGESRDNLEPMIKATQSMGVSVSSAVTKNGGVRIFQLQNVVQQKVIKNVVDALKIIDAMTLALPSPQPVIDVTPEPEETLEEKIEEALDKELTYNLFLNMIGRKFILAATKRHETFKETAAAIKVSYSKLMQVKRSTS